MITYEYKCNNCSNSFECQQSIKDSPLNWCVNCQSEGLQRVIHVGISFVKEGITDKTTLAKLAEVNTAKMGKYEKQEKREDQRQAKRKAKQALQHQMAEKVGSVATPINFDEKPFYNKINSNPAGADKINKMTTAQKENYVATGNT
jgi:putative FmdB family regulatory protein